jgi:DNA end-binding protein Ku
VRDAAELFDDIPDRKADPQMVAIAEKIIEQQEGPFDPSQFKDRYEDALRALIKQKEKGGKAKVTVEEPENTNVVDLMEALRKSLGHKPGAATARTGAKTTAKPTKAAAKAPAKRAPARKKAS